MTLPSIHGEFRLGQDPELRFAPSGVAVCTMRAVASSRKQQPDGSWADDKSCWVTLVAFKEMAENIAESLLSGHLVSISGKLEIQEWEKDGVKRQTPQILLDTIGPTLKFATAKVSKTERTGSTGGNTGGGGGFQRSGPQGQGGYQVDDPWATPAGQSDEPPF